MKYFLREQMKHLPYHTQYTQKTRVDQIYDSRDVNDSYEKVRGFDEINNFAEWMQLIISNRLRVIADFRYFWDFIFGSDISEPRSERRETSIFRERKTYPHISTPNQIWYGDFSFLL